MSRRVSAAWPQRLRWLSLVPTAVIGYANSQAQNVLVSPDSVGQPMPTPEQAAAKRLGSIGGPELRKPAGEEENPLHWGPLRFIPRLSYQLVYGDGIIGAGSGGGKTTQHTISPGVLMKMGKFWGLDLGANVTRYSGDEFSDTTGYSLALSGNIPVDKWAFSVGYSLGFSDQPQVETGTQTAELSHAVSAGAAYTYNDKFSVDTGVSLSTRQTDGFSDSTEYSTAEWLNYHVTRKTTLGLGITGGYNQVDPGADSIYGRPQVRLGWVPGERFTFQLTAGIQIQKFLGGTAVRYTLKPPGTNEVPIVREKVEDDPEVYPVFQAAVTYKVSDPLSLSLSAAREVGTSVLTDQFTETSSVNVGASQRLLRYLNLNLGVGYQTTDYRSTTVGLPVGREDEYLTFNISLSTRLFKKLSTSVFYQYSDNSSNADEFGFASNQVGLQLSYEY